MTQALNYWYRIHALPSAEVLAEIKQEAICKAIEFMAGRPLAKQPKPPMFKKDDFCCRSVPMMTIPGLPLQWDLTKRSKALIQYEPGGQWDYAGCDDSISGFIQPIPKMPLFSFQRLLNDFMPLMIPAMDAYRADVDPSDLDEAEQNIPAAVAAPRVHYRYKVYAPSLISFFDERLCRAAFKLEPDVVLQRVQSEVPMVRMLSVRDRSGVLIQTVPDYVDAATLVPIRARLAAAIRGTAT